MGRREECVSMRVTDPSAYPSHGPMTEREAHALWPTAICKQCGATFKLKRPWSVFCRDHCRWLWHSDERKLKRMRKKIQEQGEGEENGMEKVRNGT